MRFDSKYFQKFSFSRQDIAKYFRNAKRDLKIAKTDSYTEVRFSYAYQALIKAGIALIAHEGGVRVRSIPGHHIKVIDTMSQMLGNEEIRIIGHAMRKKRNTDLYAGGEIISGKEAKEYTHFVSKVLTGIEKRLAGSK